jgi:tubulin-specific chaperone D
LPPICESGALPLVSASQLLCITLEPLTTLNSREPAISGDPNASSYAYFRYYLLLLDHAFPPWLWRAVLEGYVSSSGLGSESVLQAARAALSDRFKLGNTPIFEYEQPQTKPPDEGLLHKGEIMNILCGILRDNLGNDRVVLPLLETLAYLLDICIWQGMGLQGSSRFNDFSKVNWKTLFVLVQKAHFKSNNIHKLHVALDVYRGLAGLPRLPFDQNEVLKKMASMLLHPFPKIRLSAAEALFTHSGEEELKRHDWTTSTKQLKQAVDDIRAKIDHGSLRSWHA